MVTRHLILLSCLVFHLSPFALSATVRDGPQKDLSHSMTPDEMESTADYERLKKNKDTPPVSVEQDKNAEKVEKVDSGLEKVSSEVAKVASLTKQQNEKDTKQDDNQVQDKSESNPEPQQKNNKVGSIPEVSKQDAPDGGIEALPVSTTKSAQEAKDKLKIPPTAKKEDITQQALTPTPAVPDKQQKQDMLDIVVVIPTVRRFQRDGSPAPEKYLAPMINKMWHDMTSSQRQHIKFFILNSDKEPEAHIEAESLSSHPAVTIFHKSQNRDLSVDAVKGFGSLEDGREVSSDWLSWVASENMDGAFLFEKAKTQAPYILFLEDDVWPTTNALEKLTKFVQNFDKSDWLFLDLYTPNLNWGTGMLSFQNGDKYNFQCCTQAMLFRSDLIDGVINYWNHHAREPVDDNLRHYIESEAKHLSIYGLRPNLFEHVGAFSSNPEKSTGIVEHASLEFVP